MSKGPRTRIAEPAPLTPHQSGVAACILEAMSNKEIARAMGKGSENCIEWHVMNLMKRYGARNRVDLALKLQREVAA